MRGAARCCRRAVAIATTNVHRRRQLYQQQNWTSITAMLSGPLVDAGLSLSTPARLTHSRATAPADLDLARRLHACMSDSFTSLPQLSRQLPEEVMEQVCVPEYGGLRHFMARFPCLFEGKQVGGVYLARRKQREPNAAGEAWGEAGTLRDGTPPVKKAAADASRHGLTQEKTSAVDDEVTHLFPDFLVPVKALWATVPESAEAETRAKVLAALRTYGGSLVTFHEHPEHRVRDTPVAKPADEKTQNEVSDVVLEHGYVRRVVSAPSPPPADTADVVSGTSSPPLAEVSPALAEYEIQPYEWFRVARVLPTVCSAVVFDEALQQAAAALLPAGRDVWHVLLSAPHLFSVQRDEDTVPSFTHHAAAPTTECAVHPPTTPSSSSPRVLVQFKLHPRFIPAGVAFVSEEELLQGLEAIAAEREASRCGLTTRQRRHKRKLQRQLTYLRNPTPYFDDRVLAQHLFDLLPLRGGVHQSALLGALPPHAVSAFPQNVPDLLKTRGDLFRLSDARHGVLVQRTDAPLDAEQLRPVDSVTAEEVLQCLFTHFSTRADPRSGTTISRNLSRLPRLIRERLFAMQDVVEELLNRYPDKVEVLWNDAPFASASSSAATAHAASAETPVNERMRRELQNVRGRRDFLVPFRFVGEWEEKLMVKYDKQQEKEMAKNFSHHRRPQHHQGRRY